jgi:DUF1009 family protein
MLPILGIIAGNGDLPYEIARLYHQKGGKCFVASIDNDTRTWPGNSKSFTIGEVGPIL